MGYEDTGIRSSKMLEIRHIFKSFTVSGQSHSVIRDLSFSVAEGRFYTILGQSGCGKSTLLRMIGGFDPPDSGEILLDREKVTAPSKDMMMVFQNFEQLFPWYTLKGNLVYAMKKAKLKNTGGLESRADQYLEMAGLAGFGDRYPHQLSGGMKQRGAIARALCLNPRVLLMDEPFSSLDYLTKKNLHKTVLDMAEKTGCTILLVTHDIEEALILGDYVAVLSRDTGNFKEIFEKGEEGYEQGLKEKLEMI